MAYDNILEILRDSAIIIGSISLTYVGYEALKYFKERNDTLNKIYEEMTKGKKGLVKKTKKEF